jgi:hypothetical protein
MTGRPILVRTPQTFITDGLAPAGEGTPPALVAAAVSTLAWLLIIVLVIIGDVQTGHTPVRKRVAGSTSDLAARAVPW